ncbi:MAG: M56 family metallopeptidase [Ferruginibacter sp.]|nr:M56 family metallopeptidase [Ferruginibacter sp.]
MSLLSFQALFSESFIKAISYTLVHSLWQGMILGLVAGAIILLTRSKKPSTRYNALAASLVGFTAATIATFWTQLGSLATKSIQAVEVTNIPTATYAGAELHPVAGSTNFLDQVLYTFNSYADWLVLGWMTIILLKSIQLTAGLVQAHKLKSSQVNAVSEYWNEKLVQLGRQMALHKVVCLLESRRVQVPAVIGFMKPVILIPAGLLSQLSPAEVEAILLHELAHIRRKDYLVNILQHFVEIIFFFNPAVRWVSGLIKAERENCCDEIAVSQTNSKNNYISALVAFHEKAQQQLPTFIPAFAGEKNHLLNRVKRIIYNNNKTLNNMEKKILAAGVILTSLFFVAFTSREQQPVKSPSTEIADQSTTAAAALPPQDLVAELRIATDTLPDKVQKGLSGTINTTVNGKKYKIVTKNNEVLDLYVNDQQIPGDKISEHRPVINKIMKQSRADLEDAEKEIAEAQIEIVNAEKEIENAQKELVTAHIELTQQQEEVEKELVQATKDMEDSKSEVEQSKKEMAAAKLEIEQAKKDMKKDMANAKIEIEQAKKQLEQSKIEIANAKKDIEQAKKDIAESKKMQEAITADFVKEKLIGSKAELESYQLNNDELIINGVKQSAEMHKKFKTKFVKSEKWSINYNND